MADIREFQTCPICGHHYWCASVPAKNSNVPNALLYLCHYQEGKSGDIITGCDGVKYVLIRQNKNGDGWLLETLAQKVEGQRIWRQQTIRDHLFSECPVCGGKNSCYSFPAKNRYVEQAVLFICRGIKDGRKNMRVTGRDGISYRMIKQSDDGWMLESVEQYRENARIWSRHCNGDASYGTEKIRQPENSAAEEQKQLQTGAPEIRCFSVQDTTGAPSERRASGRLRTNTELDKAYRAVTGLLQLLPEHRKKLHTDGWTDELIAKHRIVSMPLPDKKRWELGKSGMLSLEQKRMPWRKEIVEEVQRVVGNDLTGIPGFYEPETVDRETGEILKVWRMAGPTGMLFFSRDVQGHMFGAQIRIDGVEKQKYRAWSTNPEKEDRYGKPLYPNGTGLPVQAGFIYDPERDRSGVAYITEGYKKGVIGNYYKRYPFITLPGVGQFSAIVNHPDKQLNIAEFLKRIGVQIIIVAYDSDKVVNRNVLRNEEGVIELMKQYGFRVGVADWSMHRAYCKGFDDLMVMGLDCSYEEC